MRRIKTNSLGARVLSGFLSFLMIVSACPVTAFADDDVDNTPVETTTVVVDENGVHVDGEDDNGYTIVIDDESEDENVDSIPGDEDAQDQNNPDVDTPPNIDDSSDDGTNDDKAIVDDQTNPSEDAEPTEETDAEQPTEPEETEETAEPVYEYSVTLPSDKTLSEGDTLDIEATVVAKVTENDETKDVDYTFEFSGEGIDIETKSATSAAITFDKAGEYTVVGKLIVDDEEVASDEMTVKVNPIVVFDHYFTDIDESLVETSSLLVKTSDSSVFTKNTNVVSNFDDVYVIECASVEEARYVYSYYVDKVDSISDFSKVMSIATDENSEDTADLDNLNEGDDAIAQLNDAVEDTENIDYSDYIALIDTGADDADVKFSVVGDDVNDTNGHGSRMLELIKGENPDAKVMSIKVFNGSTTDAASVYAGIKLAIANDVKIINLSLVGADVEKNAVVKEAIQEAIDKDIVVIGAAGNYNLSATKFIPGCIDKVITIGAANNDGTKKSNSNYDVDYYVVSDSTSEATAIFTGMYSANVTEDSRLYDGDLNPTEIVEPVESDNDWYFAQLLAADYNTEIIYNADGTVSVIIPADSDFYIAASGGNTQDAGEQKDEDLHSLSTSSDPWYGKCSFSGSSGEGYCTSFTGNNVFSRIANTIDGGVYASCDKHWGNATSSVGAKVMTADANGQVNYKAWVSNVENIENDSKIKVTFDVYFSDNDNFDPVVWTSHTDSYEWTLRYGSVEKTSAGSANLYKYSLYKYSVDYSWSVKKNGTVIDSGSDTYSITGPDQYEDQIESTVRSTARTKAKDIAKDAIKSGSVDTYNGIIADPLNITVDVPGGGNATQTWKEANRHQIYHGRISAWKWNYVYVDLSKTTSGMNSLKFGDSYKFSDNTRLELFLADGTTRVKDKDGNNVIWEPNSPDDTKTFTLMYSDYHDTSMILKETSVGFGYRYGQNDRDGTQRTASNKTGGGGSHTTFSIDNEPMKDPIPFKVRKVSNGSGTEQGSGDINVVGTQYTLTGYAVNTNCEKTGSAQWSHTYTITNSNGVFSLAGEGVGSLPMGYYELKETKAPDGMKINNTVYSMYVLPHGCTPGNNNNSAYHTSNEVDIFIYEGTGHSGTWVAQRVAPSNSAPGTITVNSNYSDSKGNIAVLPLTESNDTAKNVDEEIWRPMGLFKADSDLDNLGMTSNGILRIPEGDGSYQGAQYQLFCTTNRADFFQYTYNNPNGAGNDLAFGAGVNSVSTVDGFGVAGTTPFNTTLYPILYGNGNNKTPVIITTDANGFAQTSMLFPYSNDYIWVEVKAPVGYRINTHLYTVSANDWYEDDNTHTNFKKLDTYTANAVNIVKITEEGQRDGAAIDPIYRYGFALYKKDLTNSNDALNNPQGDATLNGIRFAVINRSSQHIVMRNQYINQMPNANDRANIVIADGREIGANQICAIITTHNDASGKEGYISLYGLPYGKYEIVELKRDAAASANLIGQTYSNGMGSSTYANNSYLWDSTNDFNIDYTTTENRTYHDVNNISHFTWNYTAQNPDHIAQNKVFVDGFQGYKMDEEYLEVTEGDSNANDIKFAVINRSAHPVEILQSDIDKLAQVDPNWASYVDFIPGGTTLNGVGGTGDSNARIANGYVVAVLTTHDSPTTTAVSDGTVDEGTHTGEPVDGYFSIYGLPYGTYEVVELRRDADVHAGDNWNSASKGTSIYANDSFYWKNYSYTYSLTDTDDRGAHNDVRSALTKHNSPYGVVSDKQYQNEVFRDGFSFWKKDLVYHDINSHPQGDATFNDIRYAIVNTSDDNIKLFNKYTQMLPASDQPYVSIVDGKKIAPGQVCAIVTSHNKGGTDELRNGDMQGYVAMFGLPYGTYEIHELRRDATITIGDVYAGSNKLGTSIYANYDTRSQIHDTNGHPSMLFEDRVFVYTLEDTEDGVHKTLYDVNNIHQADDNDKEVWTNETVYGSIWIHKYDRETGKQQNQGTNSLAGIQFAVVNRSQWSVSYPYDPDDPNPENYEPGEVIAVVETDEEGNVHLDHMCYGSYDVYELRINNSYCDNNYSYGNTVAPHDIFDVDAYKNSDTSTDPAVVKKYGNDERANLWYCWNESIKNVRVSNEAFHEVEVDYTVSPQEGEMIRVQDQENHYDYYDLPVRGDLYMIKVNQDGKVMPYVPFLLSLVETDENGVPLQNPDGSYVVIEEHVIVTDFDGEIDTRNWSKRPKTASTVNQLDAYYNGIDFTGNKDQLKAGAGQNVWFGDPSQYVDYEGSHFVKSRGSLLAGTYVLQELRRSEANGFMRDDIEKVLMDNGQYRYIYWNTEDFDMISTKIHVVHDNQVIYGEDWDIGVDIPLYLKSEAIDTKSNTNSTIPDEYGALADTVEFGNLNVTQRYGYKTYIYRVEEDGTQHLLDETDITVLDFTGPKYFDQSTNKEYAQIKNADGTYTVVKNGAKLVLDSDGNFHLEGAPAQDGTFNEYNALHDFKVMQNFSVDTSSCQEGESICFRVDLYKAAGVSGWNLLKTHNETLTEPTQKVGIIKFVTESTDKTTRTRVAGLGGYAYGEDGMPLVNNAATTGNLVYNADGEIVGYTLVDDKIVYKNLAHDHNYRFQAYLVDANGQPVYDINGNECRTDLLAIYIDKDLDHVLNGTDIVYNGGSTVMLQKSLEGPCDGEITFSDFGMMDWILPNNPNGTNSVFIKVDLYDARGPLLKSHNANMDEEDETLRWLQIETTAMSEDGDQGVLPNGRSWDMDGNMIKDDVVLRDVIHYSNLAEPINARVEGYVYLVGYDENGKRFIDTNNGLDTPYVAYETKNFSLTGTEGDVEMRYTIKDSGQYAKRELVVCERVYMDVDGHAGAHQDGKYVPEIYTTDGRIFDRYGNYTYTTVDNEKYILHDDGTTEVLIALHEDINDEMQTVSIPEIETHLVNSHTGYKVVSREYADVTLTDTVTYRNLKVGDTWNFTAELYDQETKQPVLDADGNPVVAHINYVPTAENSTIINGRAYGTVEVPITFKQVLTALDWESEPSWVCFETLRHGEYGHSDFKYAVHNNIFDERQTVHLPTFRTTVTSTVSDPTNALAVNANDRQILAAPNQTVTDTVEIKNVGLDTIIKSTLEDMDLTITDIKPETFTLKIAAVDAETGDPIVDASGNQYTATKTVKVDVKRNADGSPVTPYVVTINGVEIPNATFFKPYPDGEGTDFNVLYFGTDTDPIKVGIDLTLDATNLKGKTIMFAETLYFGTEAKAGEEVLVEDDITKVEQMVTVPEIHTTAVNPETGDHTITVSGAAAEGDDWYLNADDLSKYDWKVKDTVSMNKITPDTDYTLVTIVMNKDTNKPVTNLADGTKFVQYTPYHSPASVADGALDEIKCTCGKTGCVDVIAVNDEFDIELNLNETDARNGGTFVVYEYLVLGNNTTFVPDETVKVPTDVYAYHNDITDEEQTIIIPEIHTEFLESHTETHVVPLEEDATVTDYVHYKGLVPGKSYTMQCVLMDKTSNKPLKDAEGNMFTKDVTFEASATGEGDVEIEFTISAELLHTFDTDLSNDHLDLDQNVQAVGPAVSTDDDGNTVVSGEPVVTTEAGKYTGTDAREEHGITDDDVKNVQHGTQIVAFERCITADQPTRVMAIHADINDEKQTILIPRIFTHLTDTCIGDHVTRWNTTETITDTVTFVSLQADKEYEISGYLVNAETGEPVLDKDGNKITATKTFTPNQLPADQVSITESEDKLIASGNVDLVFTFDSTYLKGTHVVAFEDCYYNKIKVATHSDITDEWQWTFVPEIGTTANGYVKATDNNGVEYREKVVPYGETVNIIDVVEYNKLLPGVWYEMSGTLMDKATGKALVDKDGKAITATTRFLPAETSGTVEVVFTLDTTGLENTTIVAFEECLYVGAKKDGTPNEEAVAKHEDINDVEQTVYVPKIRTTVKDENGNANVKLDGTNTNATLIDTVTYENLVPGKEYTVTGKLVYKKDYAEGAEYEYVKDANGNVITASTTFTPSAENSTINEDGLASGSVDVKFVFDASLIAGKKVVVFEDMYLEKVRVATHSDITDENQTFETGMKLHVKLVKSDFDNHEYVLKNAEITIYADEKCTQIAKDINGNDCVGTTNEKGEVEFTILTYDENQIFYAKETKAPFGYKICDTVIPIKGTAYYTSTSDKTDYTETDASKESAGVCAINLKMFDKIIIIPPKTGDNLPILPIAIITLLGILCIGAFFATKKKKVTVDNDESTNVDEIDEEEVEDSVIGLMTEDIDGDAHNGSGF